MGFAHQTFTHPAQRLTQCAYPGRQQNPRRAYHEKSNLPASETQWRGLRVSGRPGIHDPAADGEAQAAADVDARRVEGNDEGTYLRWVVVGEDGVSSGRGARLTNTDANAIGGQGEERLRSTGEHCHPAPDQQAQRNQ